jgi:hypothetical protein
MSGDPLWPHIDGWAGELGGLSGPCAISRRVKESRRLISRISLRRRLISPMDDVWLVVLEFVLGERRTRFAMGHEVPRSHIRVLAGDPNV